MVINIPISIFEPAKKEANIPNINTIPGDDVIYIDMRVLPGIKLEEIDKAIAGMTSEVAAPATPADAPVVKALSAAIKDIYKVKAKPKGIGAAPWPRSSAATASEPWCGRRSTKWPISRTSTRSSTTWSATRRCWRT